MRVARGRAARDVFARNDLPDLPAEPLVRLADGLDVEASAREKVAQLLGRTDTCLELSTVRRMGGKRGACIREQRERLGGELVARRVEYERSPGGKREALVAPVERVHLRVGLGPLRESGHAPLAPFPPESSSTRIGTPTVQEWMPITLASSITSSTSSRVAP